MIIGTFLSSLLMIFEEDPEVLFFSKSSYLENDSVCRQL